MRRSPMAAVATLALLLGTAGMAAATAPSPAGDVPLMPSVKPHPAAVIGSDAVFTLSDAPSRRFETQLFTRSLSTSETVLELGAPTFIGRASGYSMAEHDGSLAYTRWDGRLALRAPDGAVTTPDWGVGEFFSLYGPTSLSDRWLAVGGSIFDLGSGGEYDLTELTSEVLVGYPVAGANFVHVVDDRAVWEVQAWNDETYEQFHGIFTVELGDAGPVGVPVLLDGGNTGSGYLRLTGFTDDAVAWVHVGSEWDPETWESATTSSVRWVAMDAVGEPYSEAIIGPAQWADGAWTYATSIAVSFGSYGAFDGGETTLRVLDLADVGAGEQTLAVAPFAVLDVEGPLIAWIADDGKASLTDLLGREVRGAGRSPGVAPRGVSSSEG